METPHRPTKVAVIKVPINMSGSHWGKDLSMGPDHILKSAGMENYLMEKFGKRYEKFVFHPKPSFVRPKGEELRFLNDILKVSREVQALVEDLVNDGAFVILIGGDQTADLGLVGGAARGRQNGKPFVLSLSSLDGHLDLHTHKTSSTGNIHGQTLASHLGYGHPELVGFHYSMNPRVAAKNAIIIGPNVDHMRFFSGESSTEDPVPQERRKKAYEAELKNAAEWGVKYIRSQNFYDSKRLTFEPNKRWMYEVRQALTDTMKDTSGHIVLYDLDHLHSNFAPGVAMPNSEGLSLAQSLAVAEEIEHMSRVHGSRLLGTAIVEADPSKDIDNRTATAATEFVKRLTKNMA